MLWRCITKFLKKTMKKMKVLINVKDMKVDLTQFLSQHLTRKLLKTQELVLFVRLWKNMLTRTERII
jgi:hypothetical protein